MKYKHSQRADREGSFPELNVDRPQKEPTEVMRKSTRLRRSFWALKCFSQSKHNRMAKLKELDNLDVFSHEETMEDTFIVRSVEGDDTRSEENEDRSPSPLPLEEGAFDLSQALQPVPEVTEEDEEDSVQLSEEVFEDDSEQSKDSEYSSEFMTDDSTETSGLPWDSSFSLNQSFDSESAESASRVGIRPIEFSSFQPVSHEKSRSEAKSEGRTTNEERIESQEKQMVPFAAVDATRPGDELGSGEESSDGSIQTESTGYNTLFDSVYDLLERTKALHESNSNASENDSQSSERELDMSNCMLSERFDDSPVKKQPHMDLKTRVHELILRFGGSPDRSNSTSTPTQSSSNLSSPERSSPGYNWTNDLSQPSEIPKEIIRHDMFHDSDHKGFFWRSHPLSQSVDKPNDELFDASICTTEGNRSTEYTDVFSAEELEREYAAEGEPEFIHI